MMKSFFSLHELLEVTQGRLINLSEKKRILLSPSQICTDTRKIKKGDLFLALKGERFDGEDFVDEAYRKGAIGAIVNNFCFSLPSDFFLIRVNDTLKALQSIAKFYRQKLSIPLIGVTGSNGKTTVKELIAHILSTCYQVGKSKGNFNNQIGLPLSILQFLPEYQIGVLELGMNQPGEIKILSKIAQPNVGVITNIHHSHIGMMGTIEKIARAKAEMIPFLNRNEDNYLVLNEDDPWTGFFRKMATCRIITFGINKKANFRAGNINDEGGRIRFNLLISEKEKIPFNFPSPGIFNVYNVLAAIAVCSIFKVPFSTMSKAVKGFSPPPLHYQIEKCGEYNIFNDSYNANPESMRSALSTLMRLNGGRKIAILGDMLELGEYSFSLHQDLGKFAASVGVNAIFAYGRFAPAVASGAEKAGLKDSFCFESKEALFDRLLSYIKSGDWLLVKGSRKTKMEDLISMLKAFVG